MTFGHFEAEPDPGHFGIRVVDAHLHILVGPMKRLVGKLPTSAHQSLLQKSQAGWLAGWLAGHFGVVYVIFAHVGALWRTLAHFGARWRTLAHVGALWRTLVHVGALWYTLAHVGAWHTLADFGARIVYS